MSLGTVLLAFAPVAVLFLAADRLNSRTLNRAAVAVLLSEAAALTLLATLWFGSIGRGGWLQVFLLVGVLVAGAERGLRSAFLRSRALDELKQFGLGVAKYLVAGAILAWRLG